MRQLLAAIALLASPAMADDYAMYDGRTGIACDAYNTGAKFHWDSIGGDWYDRDGIMHGTTPFKSATLKTGMIGQEFTIDVSDIVHAEIFGIRKLSGNGPVKFHSRESQTGAPPVLMVTLSDGTVIERKVLADSTVSGRKLDDPTRCALYGASAGQGAGLSTGNGMIVLQFEEVPDNAVTGQIVLTINQVFSPVTIGTFEVVVPRREQEVTGGFSAQYPNDEGLGADARVLYFEPYEDLGGEPVIPLRTTKSNSWWARSSDPDTTPNYSWKYNWTQDEFRFYWSWTGVTWVPDGLIGNGLRIFFDSTKLGGTKMPGYHVRKDTGLEQEELYVRYYVKFDPDWLHVYECTGGKMPGLTGNRGKPPCGMAGGTPDGYCGWSLRMEFTMMCDRKNPTYGKIAHSVYAYTPEKKIYYGENWWSTAGGPHGNMKVGEWHCIEQRVKINTPGVKDGIVQTWVNGRLGVDRHDILLRKALSPFSPPYAGGQINGIVTWWNTFHYGGKHPRGGRDGLPGYDSAVHVDQAVVATERIGCIGLQ